jgi:hypothetical protein
VVEHHVVLGLTPEEYDRHLASHGSAEASLNPCWHAHPSLGITHSHGTITAARAPHIHRPRIDWDPEPIPI